MRDVLLIDGKHVLWRAVDAFQDLSAKQDGQTFHTGAIYGFLIIVTRVKSQVVEGGGYVVVCWDSYGRKLERQRMFEGYKQHRGGDGEIPLDRLELIRSMRDQQDRLRDLLAGLNVPQVHSPGWEADDVMGTLAARWKRIGARVGVFTGDRDLLQCADENVQIIRPGKHGAFDIESPNTIMEQYGISPQGFLYAKMLAGDDGDGIPGVRGIGMKTAAKAVIAAEATGALTVEHVARTAMEVLPQRFHDELERQLADDRLKMWYELARIRTNVPLRFTPMTGWDKDRLVKEMMSLDFRSWAQPGRLAQLLRLKGG